jgi:hypothetical protein
MANTFTSVLPTIIATSLSALREQAVISQLVNRDFDPAAAAQGDVINVTIPSTFAVSDVVPSGTNQTYTDSAPVKVPVTLNRWRKVAMGITDKEIGMIVSNIIPSQLTEMVRALANDVNVYIYSLHKKCWGYAGTAGTNPFNAGSTQAIRDAVTILDKQLAPVTDRRFIMNPDAKNNALAASDIARWDGRGTGEIIRTGLVSQTYGLDWYMDQLLPRFTSTALSAGATTVNGVQAAGVGSTDGGRTGTLSIAKATNVSPLVAGDVIFFTHATQGVQQHVVLADQSLAVGNTSVSIAPALRFATAGGEAITLAATRNINFVFHRNAIAFASRSLSDLGDMANTYALADPQTGLVLRGEIVRQNKQSILELDILYGAELARPEFACVVAG